MSRSVRKTSPRRAKPLSPILGDKEYQPSIVTTMLTYRPIKSKPLITKKIKISTGLGGEKSPRYRRSPTKNSQSQKQKIHSLAGEQQLFKKKVLVRRDAGVQVPVFTRKSSRQTI